MISVAICDDNKGDIDSIQKYVTEYMNNSENMFKISTFISGEILLKAEEKFDIVFLDIAMKGMNGIQAGRDLKNVNRNTKIVYISSFSEYWMQAINQVHAFAYLEKPIKKQDISRQLDEVLYQLEDYKESEVVFFEVMNIVNGNTTDSEFMEFRIKDILYFEYVGRKILLKTEQKEYFFAGQMKDVIEKMSSDLFASCHQSFLVNLQYVKNIKGYELVLKNGNRLPVSQKKSAEFRMKMNRFIQLNL